MQSDNNARGQALSPPHLSIFTIIINSITIIIVVIAIITHLQASKLLVYKWETLLPVPKLVAPLMYGDMRLVFKLVNQLGYLKQLIAALLKCL
jgi:hypothetical protein